MSARADDWNARHRLEDCPEGAKPAALLESLLPILPPGHALDLACGAGRNAILLAAHGWSVVGMDFSHAALARASAVARRTRVNLRWGRSRGAEGRARPGVVLLEVDL